MATKVTDIATARSARAGARPTIRDTGIALLDIEPLAFAEVLAGSRDHRGSWFQRMCAIEAALTDSLKQLPDLLSADEKPRRAAVVCHREIRSAITEILDHLDRLAPLEPDWAAFKLYLISDDPDRFAKVRKVWTRGDFINAFADNDTLSIFRRLLFFSEVGWNPEALTPERCGAAKIN